MVRLIWKTVWPCLTKVEKIELAYNPEIPLLSRCPKEPKARPQRCLYTPVDSNIILNSQKVQTTQVSIDVILREISQDPEDKYCLIPLT